MLEHLSAPQPDMHDDEKDICQCVGILAILDTHKKAVKMPTLSAGYVIKDTEPFR